MNAVPRSLRVMARKFRRCGDGLDNVNQSFTRTYKMRTFHQAKGPCALAIFDKTGTLTCINTAFAQWCEDTAVKISNAIDNDITTEFYDVTKYDHERRKVMKGGISENPHSVLKQRLMDVLVEKYKIDAMKARSAVMDNWKEKIDPDENNLEKYIKPLGDIVGVFGALKDEGVKIAICTASDRHSTTKVMNYLGVGDMVDTMRCCDDWAVIPKPHPSNIYAICADTSVKPSNTAMIGDTTVDVKLGRNGEVGTTIGVLCGAGSLEDLKPYSDVIVPDINEVPQILLKDRPSKNKYHHLFGQEKSDSYGLRT